MIYGEPDPQILQEGIIARATPMIAKYMNPWPYRAQVFHITTTARGTTDLLHRVRQQGYEVRILQHGQAALWNFQNEIIAVHIHLRLARVFLNSRSMRNMLIVNEPMVAQIAPTDLNGGIRK